LLALTWNALFTLCILSIGTAGAADDAAPQSTPSPPAQSPPSTSTYQSLLTQGFEVKNVFLISVDASTRLSAAIQQQESVMVTLQKGAVTATCWVVFTAWNQQNLGGSNSTCNVLH
jgi:hypothetical protein